MNDVFSERWFSNSTFGAIFKPKAVIMDDEARFQYAVLHAAESRRLRAVARNLPSLWKESGKRKYEKQARYHEACVLAEADWCEWELKHPEMRRP